ncbi:Polysialic acid transport protein KpsM [Burkholderia sp. AD24]|nr:Polysialic acid transport protein KpsM [Burkholderia sp. AD24]
MQHNTPLFRSIRIQLRVVGALLMREILTRYGRHNIGFLWVFFEPMVFTLGITALWTASKSVHGSNLPITAFAVTGYSSVLVWRNCANRCSLAIMPNQSLLYHRNVRVIDLFLSRIILEVTGASLSFLFLTVFFVTLGMMAPPANISLMIFGWLFLCIFGTGIGLTIGALSERSEVVERIWHTIAYLMFPLSGAVFMVNWLPEGVQKLALLLPMVHGVEMLRSGYFGSLVKPHYDIEYMIFTDLTLLFCGLFLVADASKRVEPE